MAENLTPETLPFWTVNAELLYRCFSEKLEENPHLVKDFYFELEHVSEEKSESLFVGYFLNMNLVMQAVPNLKNNTWECSFWVMEKGNRSEVKNLALHTLRTVEPPNVTVSVAAPDKHWQLRMSLAGLFEELPDFPKKTEDWKKTESTYFTLIKEAKNIRKAYVMEHVLAVYPDMMLDLVEESSGVVTGKISDEDRFVYSYKDGASLSIYGKDEKLIKKSSLVIGKLGGSLVSFDSSFNPSREELSELFFLLVDRLEYPWGFLI